MIVRLAGRALCFVPMETTPAGVWWAGYIARLVRRSLALDAVSAAYRRRVRVRGRGTLRGVQLAVAYLRRWRLTSPMMHRRHPSRGDA